MKSALKGLVVLVGVSLLVLTGRYLNPTFDAQMEKAPFGFESTFHRNTGDVK